MIRTTPDTNTDGNRLRGSEAAEYEGLVSRSYHRAYSAAYRMMGGNATDAEDLTQEAFVRIWAAFDRYDRSRPFEGWLFRILNNLAIDRWRRIAATPVCSLDADGPVYKSGAGRTTQAYGATQHTSLMACIADERPGAMPEQAYLRAEAGTKVRRALSTLSDDYRAAVLLADIQGYSYEEIADRLQCPVGTVRSRLHRGRQLFRQSYREIVKHDEVAERRDIGELNDKSMPSATTRNSIFATMENMPRA